jgi:hypothetical protein
MKNLIHTALLLVITGGIVFGQANSTTPVPAKSANAVASVAATNTGVKQAPATLKGDPAVLGQKETDRMSNSLHLTSDQLPKVLQINTDFFTKLNEVTDNPGAVNQAAVKDLLLNRRAALNSVFTGTQGAQFDKAYPINNASPAGAETPRVQTDAKGRPLAAPGNNQSK